ncbi:hypothetical protein ABK040_004763 [Willaertia magna]
MLPFVFISTISLYIGILFLILCVATGLYYLSEIAEENTILTKKVITYTIYFVIILHLILWLFDELYFRYILIGIISHIIYYQLLKTFPFVKIKSLSFIFSVITFFISHLGWYFYFTDYRTPIYDFFELLGFFFICVWIVPLSLFVSLSIGDIQLPGGLTNMDGDVNKRDILKMKNNNVVQWIMGYLNKWRGVNNNLNNNLNSSIVMFTNNTSFSVPSNVNYGTSFNNNNNSNNVYPPSMMRGEEGLSWGNNQNNY